MELPDPIRLLDVPKFGGLSSCVLLASIVLGVLLIYYKRITWSSHIKKLFISCLLLSIFLGATDQVNSGMETYERYTNSTGRPTDGTTRCQVTKIMYSVFTLLRTSCSTFILANRVSKYCRSKKGYVFMTLSMVLLVILTVLSGIPPNAPSPTTPKCVLNLKLSEINLYALYMIVEGIAAVWATKIVSSNQKKSKVAIEEYGGLSERHEQVTSFDCLQEQILPMFSYVVLDAAHVILPFFEFDDYVNPVFSLIHSCIVFRAFLKSIINRKKNLNGVVKKSTDTSYPELEKKLFS